jgi:hypothetical protein
LKIARTRFVCEHVGVGTRTLGILGDMPTE